MLNSLASLFWGSAPNNEQDNTDNDTTEQQYGNVEHLETQQDEDWIVVRTADKENSLECAHLGPPHRLHHPHHTHHHNNYHHHVQQPKCCFNGGLEAVPHNLPGASDADHLDDAAALAQSLSVEDNSHDFTDTDSVLCSLIDFGWVNHESDKNSDTESLPESVFSASSCRSHATYHPGGNRSEPWVVAPPPCFTGSQTGELAPTSSSPLENLLIEHPSMSVYLSFPFFHPLISNRPSGENIVDLQEDETENRDSNGQPLANEDVQPREETNVLQQRNNINRAAIHPGLVSAEQLVKSLHLARRLQLNKAQKHISKSKCERQNKVRECNSHGMGSSRRSKLIHPSGVRSSRFSQRF
jgi:hypothetical protein